MAAAGRRDRDQHAHQVIDVERRSPSCSPRRAPSHRASAAMFANDADVDVGDVGDPAAEATINRDRPESASLLPPPHARRPSTFDGVSVSAVPAFSPSTEATPSKRYRGKSNADGGGGGGGGGGGRKRGEKTWKKPEWADGALHLTTAVVGVGILGLPRALVDLGWALGVFVMLVATAVSLYTALLLVELCSEGVAASSSSSSQQQQQHSSPPHLPPSSNLTSSTAASSSAVGRRAGSNPDLHRLAEQSKKSKERREGATLPTSTTLPTTTTTLPTSTSSTTIPVARPPASLLPPQENTTTTTTPIKTYGALARATLGAPLGDAVSALQLLACWGLAVTYCVTGGASLASFFPRFGTEALWSLAFALAQFPVAVAAPDLERLAGVSASGAIASGLYASAAVAASARALLSVSKKSNGSEEEVINVVVDAAGRGEGKNLWSSLDAVSTILFAFGGHFVLPEIAAASSSSSSSSSSNSNSPMIPAVRASYAAVALSYFSVAVSGAAAFGESVADDVLLSRGAGPRALVTLANAAVCLHVAAGFHVFSQPCYSRFEGWFRQKRVKTFPSVETVVVETPSSSSSPSSSSPPLDATAIAARLFYVVLVATAAAALPFFSVCMALVGALAFAPATFVLPPAFAYFSCSSTSSTTNGKIRRRRAMHGAMACGFAGLSLACAVSATRGLVLALERRLRGGL